MNSIFRFYWILILAFFCSYSVAQNDQQDDLLPDTLRSLDELVVIAERYKEVIPSQRLFGEELQRLNSHSVADALRYFSGIQIKDYGGVGGLKTVDIRTLGANQLGVFYDGVQLGNAQNGQVDLGRFSLDNLEEISLYNGQKSEILQSAREFGSAGTIYLKARVPRFGKDKRTNLKALFRTGSFDLINPSFLWEQKLTSTIHSSVSAEFLDSSGKYKFRYKRVNPDGSIAWDTTAIRQNGDIRTIRLEGGLNGYLDRGKWHTKLYYYNSERGIPGAIVNNVWHHSQRQWDENFFAQGSFQKKILENYEMLFKVKYARDWMHYLNPDTTQLYVNNYFTQEELYVSLANKYKIRSWWELSLAIDHQWNTLDATLPAFVYPTRNSTWVSLATTFEWRKFKVLASGLATFVQDKHKKQSVQNPPQKKDEYTPALFLSYRPLMGTNHRSSLQIHAFYKRIFRMPTFNDIYYKEIINTYLKPEYTSQYDLGFQYRKQSKRLIREFSVKADLYYNEVENKIVSQFKGNSLYNGMMQNVGKVKIKGFDVNASLNGQIGKDWMFRGSLSYTFQKAQDYSDPSDTKDGGSYKGQIAYIPKHSGSAVVSVLYRTWDMNYSFIYVGERYHSSANIRENYEQPWYTHDLAFGKQLRLKAVNLKLILEVNNLLDQPYDVVLNYPMPGRNYKLICRFEI